MIRSEDLRSGMKAIIRDDVYNGQNGISNAAAYRGKVMTVMSTRVFGESTQSVVFEEDPKHCYWRIDQVEPYCEHSTEDNDVVIDSFLLDYLLEVL